MEHSKALGSPREVAPSAGEIHCHEGREGQPVVFVHGLLVNADLWRAVVPAVADAGLRCLAPDWPTGPTPRQFRKPISARPGAALVASFLDRLELSDVTIVANDTGGAITRILMTSHPNRIGRMVLTSSDCFGRAATE
jgi:pimeloyl-ACP methyl ester carboxylesterase